MWLFGVVAVVTCTPCIRTCLEKTFSQVIVTLPCIFILPAIALLLTLLWAFVCVDIDPTESFLETPKKKTSLQFHLQKSFSSSPKQQQRLYRTRCLCSSPSSSRRTSSFKGLMTNKTWWTLMYLSSLFPLASSINSDFELERQGNLTQLRQGPNLVECNYAKKKECLNNPSSIPELGTYIQKPGHCVVMEKAFVEGVTYPLASYPNQYFPMSVEKAYKSGMSNNYSEWSQQNQQQFKVDCPLLYNDIVANGQELMCCSEDQFIALHDQVSKIPGSCTSCKKNLRNIWCQFTCNPSNSMFLDIQQVRIMPGDGKNAKKLYPAVEQVTYYMGDDMLRDIYDFCEKDTTIFAVLCSVASKCKNGHGIVDYMGTYRFNSLGSPSSISFKTVSEMNKTQQETSLCKCTEDPKDYVNCISPLDNRLENCVDTCGSFCGVSKNEKRSYSPACYGTKSISSEEKNGQASANKVDTKWVEFQQYLAEGLETTDFTVLNYIVVIVSCLLAVGMIMVYALSLRKVHNTATTTAATTSDRAIGGTSKQMSKVDEIVSGLMRSWGRRVSSGRYPWIILGSTLLVVTTFSLGLSQVEIETDPVKLWVASSRLSYQERQRYGELFMPFYRTEQMVLIAKDGGEVTRQEYLKEAIRVQEIFTNLATHNENNTKRIMLEDICWKATGTACTINSITQYFQNSMEHFEFYAKFGLVQEHFMACLNTPQYSDLNTCAKIQAQLGRQANETIPSSMSDCPCLAAYGAPMNLYNSYLGGFPQGAEENVTLYTQSKALVATALVYNYYEKEANQPAIEWERVWIERMKQEAEENQLFDIYFMAETSVQDEIERESTGDILPVALSYSLMVIYVMLGINRWKCGKEFFVKAKFCVGFLGVICILLSVITTIGLFMWFGAKLHLIIMEVVPFLALAIGVDNIFLLVHAMDQAQTRLMTQQQANQMAIKKKASDLVSDIVSEALGEIGPSIFMASVSESVAFAFGCISPMPAVLWFAAFSAVAVLVNFILQMTILLSIMTLDKRRELSQRYDVFCCIKRPALGVSSSPSFISFSSTDTSHHVQTPMDITASAPAFVDMNHNSQEELSSTSLASRSHAPPLFDYCIDWYSWFLSLNTIKLFILLFSLGCTVASIFSIEQLQHGLPQAESMPSDSYMVSYFNTLNEYLATGPPIYFVVESGYKNNPIFFNFTNREMEAKLCKTKDFCEEFSIPKIIDALGKINPDSSSSSSMGNHHVVKTHFSKGVTYSWMDDFWSFVSPDTECCRVDTKTNAYLPVKSENQTYKEIRSKSKSCLPTNALPPPPVPEDAFMSLFRMFATASAGPSCSYGGGSIYRGQFSVDNAPIPVIKNDTSPVILKGNPNINGKEVTAFSYMVISTANPTQQDYIDLYKQSRRVAEWMSKKSGLDVWAYSIFFVFFDQYLTIIKDTYLLVGLALVAIFVIHCVYFCGLFYPLVVVLTVLNIVIQVMGLMTPLGIMLNGLSVVNLIIAAGISVEFCSHFVRLFAKTSGTGDERTRESLRRVLSSVLFGITITKIVGLSALTLADSRIFQKYYFRMYMSIVLCGFINGMVLLPVILSVCVDVKKRFQKS